MPGSVRSMQTNQLSPDTLRRLAELRPDDGKVVSIYLNLDPTEFASRQARATAINSVLDEAGRGDVLITGGGIIPPEDVEALRRQGIGQLFGPGTPTTDLISYIQTWAAEQRRD